VALRDFQVLGSPVAQREGKWRQFYSVILEFYPAIYLFWD